MNRFCVLSSLLLGAVGCGEFTDTGSGSGTLEVDARASYAAGEDRTEIRVDVTVSSGNAEDARVRIKDDESGDEIELTLAPNAGINTARFNGGFSGYRRRLELDVERDSDDLDARLEGPGRHVIDKPANGSVVSLDDVGDRLEVEWAVEDGLEADSVSVELDDSDFSVTVNEDQGGLDVDAAALSVGDESIEVRRTNSIVLGGGLVGSKFDFSYEVENEFVITE